jgi:hypothetical protein
VLWILYLAHVLVGEPASTSPEHALAKRLTFLHTARKRSACGAADEIARRRARGENAHFGRDRS